MDVVKGTTMVNANNNNLVISGTIFPQNIHKLSWLSPDGRTINQIDHIITNAKWRRSLQDVRVTGVQMPIATTT